MLDIIITHYKEPWEVCRKLFLSLELQRCIDWKDIRVTLVNDGGHRLPEEKLADLSFPIEQLDIPHGGISRARNAGMDHTKEPWLMFCDCDDSFSNIYALEDIMNVLHSSMDVREMFDMMWTKCWQEENGVVFMIPDYRVFVFCHGKIYNRDFLRRENIRFEEELNFNEDSCFNAVIFARTTNKRIGAIKSHCPVYTWIRRKGSVTTGPEAQDPGTYCNFRRNLIVTEENRLHRPAEYPGMVARTAYDAYFMVNARRITDSCKQKILDEFREWIRTRADEIPKVDQGRLDAILAISREELMDKVIDGDTHEAIQAWIREVAQT